MSVDSVITDGEDQTAVLAGSKLSSASAVKSSCVLVYKLIHLQCTSPIIDSTGN